MTIARYLRRVGVWARGTSWPVRMTRGLVTHCRGVAMGRAFHRECCQVFVQRLSLSIQKVWLQGSTEKSESNKECEKHLGWLAQVPYSIYISWSFVIKLKNEYLSMALRIKHQLLPPFTGDCFLTHPVHPQYAEINTCISIKSNLAINYHFYLLCWGMGVSR